MPKFRFPFKFVLFGAAVCLTILIVENINGRFRMNDFKVYFEAAQAFLGGHQVYGLPFGLDTGYYKYSPATLLLFIPYTLFSFGVAKVLHFIVLSCCAVGAVILLHRLINRFLFSVEKKDGLLSVIFICILIHLFRELHLGNINIILVLLVTAAVCCSLSGKSAQAGWLLGLVMMTKPYFLLLLVPLVFHQKKTVLLHLILAFAALFAVPAVFIGFTDNLVLHQEWLKALLDHNSYLTSGNTVASLLKVYTGAAIPPYFEVYLLAGLGLLYVWLFWKNKQTEASLGEEAPGFMGDVFMLECFVIMSFIPNLVITDTEHFLYSLPLIAMLASYLRTAKDYRLVAIFVFLILLYGGNSSDLVGKQMSRQLDHFGVLGLSNLLIIALAVFVAYRRILPMKLKESKSYVS